MRDKINRKGFKELEDLYKQKNFVKKEITEWIVILKIIFVLIGMVILGWFIESIITLSINCGG